MERGSRRARIGIGRARGRGEVHGKKETERGGWYDLYGLAKDMQISLIIAAHLL